MDQELYSLAALVGENLNRNQLVLVTAESCTGGWLAEVITSVPNCSHYFDRGFVTYSNDAKKDLIGVKESTLEKFGAVSEETAKEMAQGAIKNSHASVSVAITGIAGPGGGSAEKPIGTVCFGFFSKNGLKTTTMHFSGDRESVRKQAVRYALEQLLIIK